MREVLGSDRPTFLSGKKLEEKDLQDPGFAKDINLHIKIGIWRLVGY